MKLTEQISTIATPLAEQLGCSLWDVEFLKEGGQRYLRVYIDKADGVSLEHCEALSRSLDPLLDELDLIEESYIFEVSSAGAERQLKQGRDFERCLGRKVLLKLFSPRDGKKEFSGTLKAFDEPAFAVTLDVDGIPQTFLKPEIAKAKLTIDF
jgi:ribosome maturation factor RimP